MYRGGRRHRHLDEDKPRPYANVRIPRKPQSETQFPKAKDAMLRTTAWPAEASAPVDSFAAGFPTQSDTAMESPPSTSAAMGQQPVASLVPRIGAAAPSNITVRPSAGAIHPSRLGMVCGPSMATSPPANATTSKEWRRVESKIVDGLASPLSVNGLKQVEQVATVNRLVDPEVLIDPEVLVNPMPGSRNVLDDEELEECPPALDIEASLAGGIVGAKRKRSATPEERQAVESQVVTREERPIVTKKAKRQLC